MIRPKHTPSPWYNTEFAGKWMISDSYYYDGNDLLNSEDTDEITSEANAKLMAAAPEMLEALQGWQTANALGDAEILSQARISRDIAIRKATE